MDWLGGIIQRARLVEAKSFITAIMIVSLLTNNVAAQKKYERPPVKTPETFRGADAVAPTDQTSIGDLKWFEVFKDEELQKLVRTAMDQNYDLRLAVARINAARANVGLARSNQFPQFDVGADLTTTRTSANSGPSVPGQAGRKRSFGEVFLTHDVVPRPRRWRPPGRGERHRSRSLPAPAGTAR